MAFDLRLVADQAFSRAAGAPLVGGNRVRLLRDGREHYPAFLDAIAGARRYIHLESYIINEDRIGRIFAEALTERARAGVQVRVLCDWVGTVGKASRHFWRHLRDAGVDVRFFNPPHLVSPLGWMARDHRKLLTVDGHVAFVTGLCIGDQWVGSTTPLVEPWRDTGIGIVGPAVADADAAFAETWSACGAPLPGDELPARDAMPPMGDVALRIISTAPASSQLFRVDQLVTAVARHTLWISDAYFVGVSAYVEALLAAARDGVDVRLLVPGSGSDIALVQRLTRGGYRRLLEGGVRVFEWNGTMMHAKSAVADGRWARVGSSNLNLQSWLGNWELDVAVEDADFGAQMQAMFEQDLSQSTEVVLSHHRVRPSSPRPRRPVPHRASPSRAAAGALRLGNIVGATLSGKRPLGTSDARTLIIGGLGGLALTVVALMWPAVVAVPLGLLSAWLGTAWLARGWRLRREGRRQGPTGGV
jgi:cardiolipin synthase